MSTSAAFSRIAAARVSGSSGIGRAAAITLSVIQWLGVSGWRVRANWSNSPSTSFGRPDASDFLAARLSRVSQNPITATRTTPASSSTCLRFRGRYRTSSRHASADTDPGSSTNPNSATGSSG